MTSAPHAVPTVELLSAALAASSEVVLVVDERCMVVFASPAARRVLGRPADHCRQLSLADIVHADDLGVLFDLVAGGSVALHPRPSDVARVRAVRTDGRWAELEASRLEHLNPDAGESMLVVLRDVTALAETERELDRVRAEHDFNVSHDACTGLPNRRRIEGHLSELLRVDDEAPAELLMAKVTDVDELRDRFGSRDSDAIVRALGRSIRSMVTPGVMVGVAGLGEFVVVGAPGTTAADFDNLGDALLALVDMPMVERGMRADLNLVIGRTVLQPERDAAHALDQLEQAARIACRTGAGSTACCGTPSRSTGHDTRRVAADVERALADGELELFYQPIRDVHSGRIAGFEGLLRWHHADDGVVVAADFLPAIEGTALIVDIGDFVLRRGCEQLARWQRRYGDRAPSLALNVSARQLRLGDFARRVHRELARAGADPVGLCLELTETHALEREPRALNQLDRVRALGASVALDDFGTGYSSLHHLEKIGADVLKIDRAFVQNVGIDAGATAIVRAAIDLGTAFGMSTVAEGVATTEQHRVLLEMGCDRIQGFLIAPAVPADMAEAMLRIEPRGAAEIGVGDPDTDVHVLRARGSLALIDVEYVPSEEEVAALAGVTTFDARQRLSGRGRPPR